MLHITEISKSFGTQVVLDHASLHVKPGMRLGLIGPNGAGKTTLLRLIAGEMSLDEGEITARKDLRIGFLPQEIEEIAARTVMEEVLASYADIIDMEHRLKDLGDRVAAAYTDTGAPEDGAGPGHEAAVDPEELLRQMGSLQTAFEAARGYELEAQAQTIARGMGFSDEDFDRPISELSGGWRMRAALARLLMDRPDLLLLDEPTNHLDLESLIWLEEFLLGWPGALVMISHDRYFLNRLVTHIVELDRGMLDLYAGDYDHFEDEKLLRHEALMNAARNQEREIQQAESFIRRFRAKNTKAKQVQQKVRQLEKMERINAPQGERKRIKFRFPQPGRTGRVVAEVSKVRKVYGDKVVYNRLDLVVERGQKIALVGPNGAGKSTLLKLLAGVIEPDAGRLELGHNVSREYFAQHQLEVLDPDRTVLKTMEEVAARVDKMTQVRSYLGAFLFTEDDADKKVGVLSGGEKARLALARMLLDPAGLLLLDEPTNHLDMASREVLTEALRQFEGAVVFISHDRHLINAIGTEVIEVIDGRLTHFPGDWEYYQWKKGRLDWIKSGDGSESQQSAQDTTRSSAASADGSPADTAKAGERRSAAAGRPGSTASTAAPSESLADAGSAPQAAPPAAPALSYRERKEVARRHRQVEKRILALEERQAELAAAISEPGNMSDYELLFSASEEATRLKDELAGLYDEWEGLAEAVSRLQEAG
jgi:ATP-binding cassette, subfamily F, member 3